MHPITDAMSSSLSQYNLPRPNRDAFVAMMQWSVDGGAYGHAASRNLRVKRIYVARDPRTVNTSYQQECAQHLSDINAAIDATLAWCAS